MWYGEFGKFSKNKYESLTETHWLNSLLNSFKNSFPVPKVPSNEANIELSVESSSGGSDYVSNVDNITKNTTGGYSEREFEALRDSNVNVYSNVSKVYQFRIFN